MMHMMHMSCVLYLDYSDWPRDACPTQYHNEEVVKAMKQMKGEKKETIKGDEWSEEQDLILF
jgi:hypothetical protein